MKKLIMTVFVVSSLCFTACGGTKQPVSESNSKEVEDSVSSDEEKEFNGENSENDSEVVDEQSGDYITVEFQQPNSLTDFPVNDGDDQYFSPTTDDYILSMHDPRLDDEKEEYTISLVCFDEEGDVVAVYEKNICETEEEAENAVRNYINGGTKDAKEAGYIPDSIVRVDKVFYYYPSSNNEGYTKFDAINSFGYSEDDLGNISSVEQLVEKSIVDLKENASRTVWYSIPSFKMEKELYDQTMEYLSSK